MSGDPLAFKPLEMLSEASQLIGRALSRNPADAGNPLADYPWFYPPPSFQAFDYQGSIAHPNVGTGDQAILTFVVPPGHDGVIKRLSCNFSGPGFVQGSGTLVWRILANQAAIKGYDNILTELGDVKTPRSTDGILIYEAQTIELVVNNVNLAVGGAFDLGSLAGYFWPKS